MQTNTRARAFFELTKPGITVFIGISAAAGYVAATRAIDVSSMLLMVCATMLMSAGAAALNQVMERDSDARMKRTVTRPLPSGRLSVRAAIAFATAASSCGLIISLAWLPWLTTLFLVLSHISYLHLYTPLKRRTPVCTLAGAIPGALPVLAGAAATGTAPGIAPIALAAVLFTWQIPHFMALGWLGREDYARAGCPMLFIIDATGRQSAQVSLLYAATMLASAYLVGLAASAGTLYAMVSTIVGVTYILFAWRFLQRRERATARRLFFMSLIALPALLGSLAIDLLALS